MEWNVNCSMENEVARMEWSGGFLEWSEKQSSTPDTNSKPILDFVHGIYRKIKVDSDI